MIEFLTANWLWIVFVGAMVAMHRHGGCGGHNHGHHADHDQGRHNQNARHSDRDEQPVERADDTRRLP